MRCTVGVVVVRCCRLLVRTWVARSGASCRLLRNVLMATDGSLFRWCVGMLCDVVPLGMDCRVSRTRFVVVCQSRTSCRLMGTILVGIVLVV
jgi:hypothetical protein